MTAVLQTASGTQALTPRPFSLRLYLHTFLAASNCICVMGQRPGQ